MIQANTAPVFLWWPRRSQYTREWVWGKAWRHTQEIENHGDMRHQFGRYTKHHSYTKRYSR